MIAHFQERIAELEQLILATDATPRSKEQSSSRASIKLTWREGKKAPCKISSSYFAVVTDEGSLYIRKWTQEVYAYSIRSSSWSQLSKSPTNDCPSVIINNLFTLVGGYHGGTTTNQLFSLTGKGSGRRWTEKFPPMPTKRYQSTALCTEIALIVAGGRAKDRLILKTVEIMNIN